MPPSNVCSECAKLCATHLTRVRSPTLPGIPARAYPMLWMTKLRLRRKGSDLPEVMVLGSGKVRGKASVPRHRVSQGTTLGGSYALHSTSQVLLQAEVAGCAQ